jgi:endonuclease YncB( thermonuclease family)
LRRVNAPERGEPGYEEAKAALEAKILHKRVRLIPYARDRYGRLIADVAP